MRIKGQEADTKRKERHAIEQFNYRASIIIRAVIKHHKKQRPTTKQKTPVELEDYDLFIIDVAMELGGMLDNDPLPNLDKSKSSVKRTPTIIRTKQTSMFDMQPSYTV